MRLDQALVERGLCESRTEAQELIVSGNVLVDGSVVKKQSKNVTESSTIVASASRKFVSRGGLKLEGAFLHVYKNEKNLFKNFEGKNAIDVGSSTGGFTHCLLHYGVTSVLALDIGTSQLHTSLRTDPKVTVRENTDIRTYTEVGTFDVIVADLSFISLEKVFNHLISLGKNNAEYFILIKPQFEVGKGNTKKGIVKGEEYVQSVLNKYKTYSLETGLKQVEIFPSAIKGGDGNQEYFIYFQK